MLKSSLSALASLFLALPGAHAEAHCPGNVASVHVRHIAGSLTLVPVAINHTGPYDFMVDTGSQLTTIDPRLGAELHLKAEGTAGIIGVGSHTTTAYTHLDLIEIGQHAVAKPVAFVQDISHLQASDPRIRGVIGGDILRHFDVLLDQDKNLLCLDTEGVMQRSIRGERIPLVTPPTGDGKGSATEPLIAEVHLPRLTDRTLYLLIDSGANVPYLCDSSRGSAPSIGGRPMHVSGGNGPGSDFVVLPAQDMRIGSRVVHQISFVTTVGHSTAKLQVDGMLPTGLFRRIYIDYNNRFVVLEPW
jgi:Aspartyl protease